MWDKNSLQHTINYTELLAVHYKWVIILCSALDVVTVLEQCTGYMGNNL